MKNSHFMKKIFLTLALVAVAATSAFAQVGIGAGYANNAQKLGSGDPSTSNGFYVEGFYNIPVAGGFSIAPGVRYTFLGKTNEAGATILGINLGASSKTTEHYVGIPVMAQYAIDLGSAKIFAFAGPTFNMGLASSTVISANAGGIGGETKPSDNYGDNSNYLRTNVFVGGGLGVQVGSFQIKGAYDYGVLNRLDSDNTTLKDSQFRVGVAYLF